MGLTSLFIFTLLGGVAACVYLFETIFDHAREGNRPWMVVAVVLGIFAVGLIAATTHVHGMPRAISSFFNGTINFGAGMVHEVAISGIFFILALVDLILLAVKKQTPYALRVITSVFGVICAALMGAAYIHIYGNVIWCDAPATILNFIAGDLAAGMALYWAVAQKSYDTNQVRILTIVLQVIFALALVLEIMAFSANGVSATMMIAALIIGPIASIALVLAASKCSNAKMIVIAICVASVVAATLSRYAFYASWLML